MPGEDDVPDLEKTSLAHSVRFFERDFLHPMMKSRAGRGATTPSTRRRSRATLGAISSGKVSSAVIASASRASFAPHFTCML